MRESITFYTSYLKSIEVIKGEARQFKLMKAILMFGIHDIEPDFGDDETLKAVWCGILPNIIESKKRIDNGKKGGVEKNANARKDWLLKPNSEDEKAATVANPNEEESGYLSNRKDKNGIEEEEKEKRKEKAAVSGGTSSNQPEPPPPKPVNALYKSVAGKFFDLYIKRGNKDVMTFRGIKALETLIDEMGCSERDIDKAVAFAKGGALSGFKDPKYNRTWQPHPVWNKSVSSLEDLTLTDPNGNLRINKILADMDAEATATFNPVQMGGSYM